MLTIRLPSDVCAVICGACHRAGRRETGGMLFGEHVAEDEFRVVEVTVAGTGTIASFVRELIDSVAQLERFFRRTNRDYKRFNYLGEWHSHPFYELRPSTQDDRSMFEIVNDPGTAARFAVSVIVRLAGSDLEAQAFAYFRKKEREDALIVFEES